MTPTRPHRAIRRTPPCRRAVAGLLVVFALVAVLRDQLLASSIDAPPVRLSRVVGPDGAVPDGTTVFDGHVAGVARLDPALLAALRRAASDAADEGVQILVDSGWRSPEYQQRLLDEAVVRHGSEAEAARWVATPDRSLHVSGDAVDLGPAAATAWLGRHGAAYGLCQTYGNEPWHFELRPAAADHGCPPTYADPTHDPRLRR